MLQVARDFSARYGYIPHPRVFQVEQDGFAGDFANHFTHAGKPVSFHCGSIISVTR
jgi:hypothetical protein